MIDPTIKRHYQDQGVARSYDRERFSSPIGQAFDVLEKRSILRALRAVRREVPRPRILDVPCGTGRATELLLDRGWEVVGGDISPAMIDLAREKCARFGDRASFRQLDLDHLELPDDSYDLVTCIRLLHHLNTAQREAILRELARVSIRFVIVNVSYSSPFYRLRRRIKRTFGQGISRASSTDEEIAREAGAAGLRVTGRYYLARYLSEDLILLLEKSRPGRAPDPIPPTVETT